MASCVTPDRPDACLFGRFAAQAARAPEAIAATFADSKFSYADLRRRANAIAHRLIALGVKPDMPVALALDRSFDLPAAVLGVLAAGGAYVPIDPRYPADFAIVAHRVLQNYVTYDLSH